MVDCRLCMNHYTIFRSECDKDENIIVCLAKEMFIDWEYVTEGPCENYVDVDLDVPRDRDL